MKIGAGSSLLGGKGALTTALALGALTSFLVWRYVSDVGQTTKPVEMVSVVVASAPIQARSLITPEMVRVQQLPAEARLPGAPRSTGEVVGKIARASLTPGEQVLSSKVYLQREESGLAFMIPEGMRGVSVSFNEVMGSGGMVLPGDRVDVIGVFEVKAPSLAANAANANPQLPQSNGENQAIIVQGVPGPNNTNPPASYVATLVLQDVEVLAVAQRVEGEDTRDAPTRVLQGAQPGDGGSAAGTQVRSAPQAQPAARTATLSVSPEAALKLVLAEERGRIRLALRRAKDSAIARTADLALSALVPSAGDSSPAR